MNGTNNNLSYKWLVGILVTAVFGLMAAWGFDINSRVSNLEKTVATQTALLATVNARQEMLMQSLLDIRTKVDGIYEFLRKDSQTR